MPSTPSYRDRVLGRLLSFGPVRARAMFGGFGLYIDGVMFALIAGDRLFFKADDSNRADYREEGSKPFAYESRARRIEMSYWHVPPAVFDDPARLAEWAAKAHMAAHRARTAGGTGRRRRGNP